MAEKAVRTRRAVETLRPQAAGQGAPDYTETLGAMDRDLKSIVQRLIKIEASPAMTVTPEGYGRELATRGKELNKEIRDQLIASQEGFRTVHWSVFQFVPRGSPLRDPLVQIPWDAYVSTHMLPFLPRQIALGLLVGTQVLWFLVVSQRVLNLPIKEFNLLWV